MSYRCLSISVPNPTKEAFQYVSDFRHAVWDPRVKRATKTTNGPLGVGSKFELTSPFLFLTFHLPYEITVYEPPNRLVLTGRNRLISYRDEIGFVPDGDGTKITYCATMTLRTLFKGGLPLLKLTFPRICGGAVQGLKQALEGQLQVSKLQGQASVGNSQSQEV